jgi:hypothetical protein
VAIVNVTTPGFRPDNDAAGPVADDELGVVEGAGAAPDELLLPQLATSAESAAIALARANR